MTQTSPDRRGRPRTALAGVVLAVALVAPAAAQAHISVHPNTVPAGAFATLDVRMPGEQEGAHVTKLDLLLPSGFTSVDYQNVPGWNVSEVQTKLTKPIQTDNGPVNQEVSQIIWTWTGPLGRVDNGQFIDFPLSVAIPGDAAGKTLKFKAVQSYSNGQVVRWIEPSLDDPNPAPTINVTA
ncbi:MAG TPA: YcnI family protein, partial [Solirubrobacteraceae bacterium]